MLGKGKSFKSNKDCNRITKKSSRWAARVNHRYMEWKTKEKLCVVHHNYINGQNPWSQHVSKTFDLFVVFTFEIISYIVYPGIAGNLNKFNIL